MRKKDELTREHTCMQHAHPEEMVFVLLSRDAAAPVAIRAWIAERLRLGKNAPSDAQIVEAEECAKTMEAEGRRWVAEQPDVDDLSPSELDDARLLRRAAASQRDAFTVALVDFAMGAVTSVDMRVKLGIPTHKEAVRAVRRMIAAPNKLVTLPDEPQIDPPAGSRAIHIGEPGFNEALLKGLGTSSVFVVDPAVCASCGHQHATAQLGGICVGCPCDWRRS